MLGSCCIISGKQTDRKEYNQTPNLVYCVISTYSINCGINFGWNMKNKCYIYWIILMNGEDEEIL